MVYTFGRRGPGVRIIPLRPSFPEWFQNVRNRAFRCLIFGVACRQRVAKHGEKQRPLHFSCSALFSFRRVRRGANRKRNNRRLARFVRCLNIIRARHGRAFRVTQAILKHALRRAPFGLPGGVRLAQGFHHLNMDRCRPLRTTFASRTARAQVLRKSPVGLSGDFPGNT